MADSGNGPGAIQVVPETGKEEKRFYVYILRRPDQKDPLEPDKGCPFYVGKGCGKRTKDHRKEAKRKLNNKNKSIKVNIIHKLWINNLDYEIDIILNNLTEQEALKYEEEIIKIYGRIAINTGCLSNMTDKGLGTSGFKQTTEAKAKIREAKIGERNATFGKVHTEEFKKYLSDINKGKVLTKEHKQKISDTNKKIKLWNQGKKIENFHTEESKLKMSEIRKEYYKTHEIWNKGKKLGPLSKERKKKISDSRKKSKEKNNDSTI